MKFRILFLGISILITSCASVENVDRSLVASPLMSFGKTSADNVAPHSGLRGNGTAATGGCSACAH